MHLNWMTTHLLALLVGFLLDLVFGDPRWLPHPVCGMGWLIGKLEQILRRIFASAPSQMLAAGCVLVVLVAAICTGAALLVLYLCSAVSPLLGFAAETILCFQLLAAKSLRQEGMRVYTALEQGDLPGARHAVSMIVGRDTMQLDEAGVAKAAVETVAENTSDGVVAPLLFMALGGGVLGVFYKACNTMDSMVGYRNEAYLYFGRAAAKLDDVLNLIPARISGALMCVTAWAIGFDGQRALRIFLRDRRQHLSPNSAHTEAACAGALGIELGGGSVYSGTFVEKPKIGDGTRQITAQAIPNSCRLMLGTGVLALLVFCVCPLVLGFIFG